jgi:hypothetical protein
MFDMHILIETVMAAWDQQKKKKKKRELLISEVGGYNHQKSRVKYSEAAIC